MKSEETRRGTNGSTFEVTKPTERDLRVTRVFDAPRTKVFEALTKPAILKQWLNGPPGWSMSRCEVDAKVGGTYRYEWRHQSGKAMGLGGVFREAAAPERLVVTERFDEAWYPGEALVTTTLEEAHGRTTLNLTIRYESNGARDAVVELKAIDGLGASYDTLADVLAKSA